MSLDFSSDKNLVYWSNKKEIKQLSLQTGISVVIPFHHNDVSSVPFPEGIAVDWISGKLYWTDAKRDAIYVGDLRNGRKVTIIEGKIDSPKAIIVSPSNGWVKQITVDLNVVVSEVYNLLLGDFQLILKVRQMLSNIAVSVPVIRLGMYCPCSDMCKWLNFPSSGFWGGKKIPRRRRTTLLGSLSNDAATATATTTAKKQ